MARLSISIVWLLSIATVSVNAADLFCIFSGLTFPPFNGFVPTCSNDPNDTEQLEGFIGLPGGCDLSGTYIESVRYTGRDGGVTVATALETIVIPPAPTYQATTLTFHYAVPITNLAPGETATELGEIGVPDQGTVKWFPAWVQDFQTSIVWNTISSTVPTLVTVTSPTTTTLTATETTTVTPSGTVTVTSGTRTIVAPRQTVTTTRTVTPRLKTVTKITVTKSTKTVSCITPCSAGSTVKPQPHQRRQAPGGNAFFEPPNCGAVTTTTLPTVVVVTSTSTVTDTPIVITSTTTTQTETAPAVVNTNSVRATTTVTPTRIITRFTVASRRTTTISKTVTVVHTYYPHGKGTRPCTTGAPKALPKGPFVGGSHYASLVTKKPKKP